MRYLQQLARAVDANAASPFLIEAHGDRVLTHAEAHARAVALAAELRRRGLRRGDRLALSVPNSVELAVCYLASLYAGLVIVPMGSGFGRDELRSILQRARPRFLVGSGDPSGVRPREVAEALGVEILTLAVDGESGDLDVWDAAPPSDGWQPFDGSSSGDLAAIHFTSGSTGTPRGVGHRIRDFVGNAMRFADAVGLDETNRFHATLPMTYMAGYYNLLLLPLSIGASVVVDRAFDARSLLSFWDAPVRHSADVLWFVPTIMAMLLQLDRGEEGREHCREHVRFAACGTAPLDPALRERFEDAYGITVHESYGLSETLLVTSSTPAAPAAPGSVGAALPGCEIQIRAGADAAPVGSPGAVLVSSPDTMVGYLEAYEDGPVFRSPLIDERWLDTGDIGVLEADGRLRITGRAKEIIIRGGVNVSPAAVEHVLEAHAAVERIAAVGVPHDILGEEIAAVVVCSGGQSLATIEDSLKERSRELLEQHQQPGIYLEIDELPLTPTGKVRRAALRDVVIDRLGLPQPSKGFTVDAPQNGVAATRNGSPNGANGRPAGRLVDLSHPIREGMTTYPSPNHPRTEVTVLARHHIEGRATRRLVIGTHTGTHADAPLHFVADGAAMDALDLETFVGPAAVVDLTPVAPLEEIGLDRLRAAIGTRAHHRRLLLRLDWSHRFDSLDYYERSPYLSAEACEWLVQQGVALLGMDIPSPDDPRNGFGSGNDSPNHQILLGAGVVLLEYLTNLERLESGEVFLMALPLPVAGADGAPTRVVALDQAP